MIPSRHDWLLLFLDAEGGPYEPDQVRVMKGLFLLSQAEGHPAAKLYKFEPYDYGPFDSGVYQDLQSMRLFGQASSQSFLGSSRRIYSLTEKGKQRVAELKAQLNPGVLRQVEEAKRYVTTRNFDKLLEDLYADYPAFAENSVARVARKAG